MCGIAGWHASGGDRRDPALLATMLAEIIHRGPDDEGSYFDGPVALGIRRLSIIDVAGGHQPIGNEDGTVWVTLNGEIYNFRDLHRELEAKGHVFRTRSDTEVIVHAYEEWGKDCIDRFNGIFGIALWDVRNRSLLLARDRFGVKPLYYYERGQHLVWASEIKALFADPEVPRRVDAGALDLYLTFRFVPSPYTMFEAIRKLPPGHILIKDAQGVRVERYARGRKVIGEKFTEHDWICLLRERLQKAVERQMMSDVPLGALLSGGIDSGAVVAIMSQATDRRVQTFTIGFAEGEDVNELAEAQRTAALFCTEHRQLRLTSIDYEQMLRTVVWHLDEPVATTSALAMFSVCKLAREHVTVVLTGQGADEPFAGYPRYLGERYGAIYRHVLPILREGVIRPLVEAIPRNERLKRAVRCLGTEDITARFAQIYAVFPERRKAELLRSGGSGPSSSERAYEIIDYWRRDVADLDPLVQMSYIDARLSLSDDLLLYGDKMSMAASVEARVPFLDTEYMEVAEALPPSLRIRGRTQKYAHKKSVEKWLPREIINRRKRGFETPVDRWFRSELSGYVRSMLLAEDAACLSYFRREAIETLLSDHIAGRQDHQRQLFCLLTFELWHRQFIAASNGRRLNAPEASSAPAR